MENLKKNRPSSPRDYEELDGFLFVPDDDLDITYNITPKKSPSTSPYRNAVIPAVMTALSTVVTSENLLVVTIAKTILKGGARILGGIPVLRMGALIAGGIYAYTNIKNQPIKEILRSLSPLQQKQLIMRLRRHLRIIGAQDLAMAILNRTDVKEIALEILSDFLEEKCGLRLIKS